MWFSPKNEPLTRNYDRQTLDSRFSVPEEYHNERNLHIETVRSSDAGMYRCISDTHQDSPLAEVQLVINGKTELATTVIKLF